MTFNEYQEEWLRLMETTKLPQTKLALYDGNGYCCLGLDMRFVEKVEPEAIDRDYYFRQEKIELNSEAAEHLCLYDRGGEVLEDKRTFHDAITEAGYVGRLGLSLADYNDYGASALSSRSDPAISMVFRGVFQQKQ